MTSGIGAFAAVFVVGWFVGFLCGSWAVWRIMLAAEKYVERGKADGSWGGPDAVPSPLPPPQPRKVNHRTMWD